MYSFQYLCLVLCAVVAAVNALTLSPPTIDIQALLSPWNFTKTQITSVQDEIVSACKEWGFFHITNHGLNQQLESNFRNEMHKFFSLPKDIKYTVKRRPDNSRGYADDELTKQLVDSKEILDIGQEPFTGLSPQAQENQALDGVNLWPDSSILPTFRVVNEQYYNACLVLSDILLKAILTPLAQCDEVKTSTAIASFTTSHSSFLRLNMYPVITPTTETSSTNESTVGTLGISRHTDAGALTLLLQDSNSALQVYSGSKQDFNDGEWISVMPVPNAITVNLGDMLQVWSNGLFKAPEHRVLASQEKIRYSAPFFYNPAYDTIVDPILCYMNQQANSGKEEDEQQQQQLESPKYNSIRWGDYRSQRFAGDYADVGEEIQIEVYQQKNEKDEL